jgi:hypothetical protein
MKGKSTGRTQTTPKGYEIPVPTRKEFYEALEKVAKTGKSLPASRPKK